MLSYSHPRIKLSEGECKVTKHTPPTTCNLSAVVTWQACLFPKVITERNLGIPTSRSSKVSQWRLSEDMFIRHRTQNLFRHNKAEVKGKRWHLIDINAIDMSHIEVTLDNIINTNSITYNFLPIMNLIPADSSTAWRQPGGHHAGLWLVSLGSRDLMSPQSSPLIGGARLVLTL